MKKIILLLTSYIFIIDPSFSQEIEWQNTIGGSSTDDLKSFLQTTDGGFICAGTSHSNISGDKTENTIGPSNNSDYWIVKVDSNGNVQWDNTIGGNEYDYLYSCMQTNDGGYILGGSSKSNISGDKTQNNWDTTLITEDYWILKLNNSGSVEWQKTIGGTNSDNLRSIDLTNDGGYILGGFSDSDSSGDKTENTVGPFGEIDYWVVKIDSVGNIQWQNTIGGNYRDDLIDVHQTSDGGYILGGYSTSNATGDKTEGCFGSSDYWIIKLDSFGTIEWQNTIGGNTWDWMYSVQQTIDGGYICGGLSESGITGEKTEASIGDGDYWIIKLDTTGAIQWQNTIGGTIADNLRAIKQTSDGGYLCGGYSLSNISGDKTENCIGDWDYWILKLNPSGDIEWQNTIGGNSTDALISIEETSNNDYILGGYSYSDISGDKTENSIGFNDGDYWIIKLSGKFNSITGKLFIDTNNNQIQDIGEPDVPSHNVTELNTGGFTFSQSTGVYNLTVLDTGDFMVSSGLDYYNQIPVIHFVNFSAFQQTDSLNDFAFQSLGVFNDLCSYLTPMGNFRAGFDANYMITYQNVGTTTLNGTVIFFPDTNLTYVSSNVIPTSTTTDSVVWDVGTLTPFQVGTILVTVHVNAGTPIGTLINSNVRIEPFAGDANTTCNVDGWEVYVTGPVDPNAILVDRDTVLTTELSSPPYLNYIIYFQNTGNDTAFNVKILNPIDTFKLQLNTLEFVASSHPMNMSWIPWERNMEFKFDNILLPDSNVNEPASHGFIRYRIKPKTTLVAGDSINSTAYIYFDFNAPVQTNTAVTEIVLPTGAEEFEVQSLKFKVFPNPVRDELIVNSYSLTGEKAEIKIYDLFGRKVHNSAFIIQHSAFTIDVSRFSQGVYIIEMSSGEQVLRGKFLKE